MPIQILPARLANQIAAGEVVERPASVVKELVENSLDSGATEIEVEVDKGGHKRIVIRDNGVGINKDELALALSRHATSKISTLDDLEHIASLGFRGEALASISSVSRLSLCSKPVKQSQAWQARSEGRDMQVELQPIAHPNGTSVEVVDLFFNTPARRKFLRTEKTEFNHIDEVIRRIALSRFDVSFSLKHNGKILRKYAAANDAKGQLKRLSAICNSDFSGRAIELNSQYQELKLHGWLSPPEVASEHAEFQYFYVNGRVMRDKLIGHAIKQAFEGLVSANKHSNYVLYLQIEPEQVDVNVHPAKHEVRFHQARLVHDFIFRALNDGISQYFEQQDNEQGPQVATDLSESSLSQTAVRELPQVEPSHDYIRALKVKDTAQVNEATSRYTDLSSSHSGSNHQSNRASSVSSQAAQGYQQLMSAPKFNQGVNKLTSGQWLRLDEQKLIVGIDQSFYVVEIAALYLGQIQRLFAQQVPISQPLLMPVSIDADAQLLARAKLLYQPLLNNSVEIGWTPKRVILRKVPAGFRQFQWVNILAEILNCESTESNSVQTHLLNCIGQQELVFSNDQIQELWDGCCVAHSENLEIHLKSAGKTLALAEILAAYV